MRAAARRLPAVDGEPIRIRFAPDLTAVRDRVESRSGRGRPVHAATYVRNREMILDTALRRDAADLARIFVHELFHFAWLRLGNQRRRSFEMLLEKECHAGARGELGWSAERVKQTLSPTDRRWRTRRWREYACESFCDTAAWLLAGLRRHKEFNLAARFRGGRRAWFESYLSGGPVLI